MANPSTSRRTLLGFAAVGIPVVAAGLWLSLKQNRAAKKVVVADSRAVASALFYVALKKEYFVDEGLEVELVSASSGKEALDDVIVGKADLCMVAEAPFVRAVLAGKDVDILATVETSERNTAIIVPSNSPIQKPSDLKGKKIGFCPGTASEYFLSVFLTANNLTDADIVRVPLTPKDAHESLAKGEVDVVAGWQEIRARADKALGARTRALYAIGVYLESWNLVGLGKFIDENQETCEAVLRAYVKAQEYVATHTDESVDIASAAIDVDRATIAEMWPDYAFDVSLDQALLSNLEGHWRMISKGAQSSDAPNFIQFLASTPLVTLDPARVTYFR